MMQRIVPRGRAISVSVRCAQFCGALLFGCASQDDAVTPGWSEASTSQGTTLDGANTGAVAPETSTASISQMTSAAANTAEGTLTTSNVVDGDTSSTTAATCASPKPGRSPLRRLTRFEYSNTLADLVNDTEQSGQRLPAELLGNGFANDADSQPTSTFLIEQYATIAAEMAERVATSNEIMANWAACVPTATPDNEATCFQTFISKFAPRAYRRPVTSEEIEELSALQGELRMLGDFRSSVGGVIDAILQSPDFLYRLEYGEQDGEGHLRPSGPEMASRLSYFLWGSPPDDELMQAAQSLELATPAGVLKQAERLLAAPQARKQVQFFFESLLPINALTDQTRDATEFPTFNAEIGGLMYEETWRFLENEIFAGTGTWDAVLTAPYTFVNEQLASFYGMSGVSGEAFRKVDIDTTKRLGLLTQGGMMTGTTVSNVTNPVRRGGFLLKHILCLEVPLPPAELAARAVPPEPYGGSTGRERYTKHSQDSVCATCHALLDPPGFALENFDAVGRWRDTENDVVIDASGDLSLLGAFNGPVELVQRIAASPDTHRCFASEWQTFAYGRMLDAADDCNRNTLERAFDASGHNVRQLLLDLTQTDGFLYLGERQ